MDVLRLDVAQIMDDKVVDTTDLQQQLTQVLALKRHDTPQAITQILSTFNSLNMTLLERQRSLQSLSQAYGELLHAAHPAERLTPLCLALACGYKRLLLQMLQGRPPSRPHLAWTLYMALYFLSQAALRQYQCYQQPTPQQWRDCHLLYWLAEQHQCLDEYIPCAFEPLPANSVRGLYQQLLLMAQSNPFQLASEVMDRLFNALAPYAHLPQLVAWDAEDELPGLLVDLEQPLPCIVQPANRNSDPKYLRRLDLEPMLVALNDPAPLQSALEQQLLDQVRHHWLGQQPRRHARTEQAGSCQAWVGVGLIHAHLSKLRPNPITLDFIDVSPGGARMQLRPLESVELHIGQPVLLLTPQGHNILGLIRWRHQNAQGLQIGLRYFKGLIRPAWLRRTPNSQAHPGILQSTPMGGSIWQHGLWLSSDQFSAHERLWLQLDSNPSKSINLPTSNIHTPYVMRCPLQQA